MRGILGVNDAPALAGVVEELFKSLGPLDELTIHGCDLQIFLSPRIYPLDFRSIDRVFPPVQELTILEPLMFDAHQGMDRLEHLARSRYQLGQPLGRVTIRGRKIPATLAERLRQWVGAVECSEL